MIDSNEQPKALRIGEVAKLSGFSTPTINFWTDKGLLKSVGKTDSGYRLYPPDSLHTIKQIVKLKKNRYTLKEIKEKLEK